MMKFEMSY